MTQHNQSWEVDWLVSKEGEQFEESRWWNRGWTLQELLAPRNVVFLANDWTILGTKAGNSGYIAHFTNIHREALEDFTTISSFSVAQRMSWAANRQTTKAEDIAYCLMGIFDVSMAMVYYGNGEKAFQKLQEEILKRSDDHSILAWDLLQDPRNPWTTALAPSPDAFRYCGSIVRSREINPSWSTVTNIGVHANLPLLKTAGTGCFLGGLNCVMQLRREMPQGDPPDPVHGVRDFQVWIPLRQVGETLFVKYHLPLSKVFLQQSYALASQWMRHNIYISNNVQSSGIGGRFLPQELPSNQHHTVQSDGVLLAFGAGNFNSTSGMFQAVADIRKYTLRGLGARGSLTMSHRAISVGSYSTIVSVAWNMERHPIYWLATTIRDPAGSLVCSMLANVEWRSLFEAHGTCHGGGNAGSSQLQLLHERIKKTYGDATKEILSPLILMEKHALEDLLGQKELIVEFIIREPQQRF